MNRSEPRFLLALAAPLPLQHVIIRRPFLRMELRVVVMGLVEVAILKHVCCEARAGKGVLAQQGWFQGGVLEVETLRAETQLVVDRLARLGGIRSGARGNGLWRRMRMRLG